MGKKTIIITTIVTFVVILAFFIFVKMKETENLSNCKYVKDVEKLEIDIMNQMKGIEEIFRIAESYEYKNFANEKGLKVIKLRTRQLIVSMKSLIGRIDEAVTIFSNFSDVQKEINSSLYEKRQFGRSIISLNTTLKTMLQCKENAMVIILELLMFSYTAESHAEESLLKRIDSSRNLKETMDFLHRDFKNGNNFYDYVGIDKNATANEINKTYKKSALKYHPDKNVRDSEHNIERFRKIQDIVSILRDEATREFYDGFYLVQSVEN